MLEPQSKRRHGFDLARSLVGLVALSLVAAGPAGADWLAYLGGGLEPIVGGWRELDGAVVFNNESGTFVSVPYADVDLPTSALITWHLGGRLEPPSRAAPAAGATDGARPESSTSAPCRPARLVRILSPETLEVAVDDAGTETIHVACLDAPEADHRFPDLGWYGRTARVSVERSLEIGQELCLGELAPKRRDESGHRVLEVELADGRDYAATLIASGLAMLRAGPCDRTERYRRLETRAIATERGLWAAANGEAAIRVASLTVALAAGPPPRRQAAIGGT